MDGISSVRFLRMSRGAVQSESIFLLKINYSMEIGFCTTFFSIVVTLFFSVSLEPLQDFTIQLSNIITTL